MDYSLNIALIQFLSGVFFGLGFALAFNLVGVPLRRFWP